MTSHTPKPTPLHQITEVNQRAMAQAARAQARMMRDVLILQSHLLAFTARRLKRDIAVAERLADCGDAPDLMNVAQTFCAEAMSDYAEEAAAFMRLSTQVANGDAQAQVHGPR